MLELKGGSGGDALVCELQKWDGITKYEAVSYLRSTKPGLDLTLGRKRLSKTVMPNLHAALKHLRLPDCSRFLWVNAICIDHGNTDERSHHVHLMHRIFNQASQVCLWLGDVNGSTDGDTRMAFKFADQLLAPNFFDVAANNVKDSRQWKALLDLIMHPLFERRWVAQEVAVAGQATLHYGHDMMNWTDFADVVTMFEHAEKQNQAISRLFRRSAEFNQYPDLIGDVQALGASRFINLTSNIFKPSRYVSDAGDSAKSLLSLEDLVFQLASFKGADPHDVVYACVPLSQESHGTGSALSERPRVIRKAADKFLGLLRRKIRWDEKPTPLRPGQVRSVAEATTSLFCGESSDYDAKRETDTFVSQGQQGRCDQGCDGKRDAKCEGKCDARCHRKCGQKCGRKVDGNSVGSCQEMRPSASNINGTNDRECDGKCHRKCYRMPYNVNYDLPVLSTYKEFIAHVLRTGKSLDILCRPWAPPTQVLNDYIDGGVPSWISTLDRAAFGKSPPTFTSYVRINADPLIGLPGKGSYKASLDLPACWEFPALCNPSRLLYVDGFVLTTISETRTEALGGNIPFKWLQFAGWKRRDEDLIMEKGPDQHSPKDSGDELPPESLWRTLVADRGPNAGHAPPFYRRACQFAFKQIGVASAINTEQLLDSTSLPMVKEFLQRVQEVVWNRQLVKTKRGYLGLAPDTAEKSDMVCILYGCSVPVVIREADNGNHELVGECYIDGMMDGAALAVQTSQRIPKKTFKLQ